MKDLFKLFSVFFKIGLFTFGGGYAMISQFRENVVEKYAWLTEDEFIQVIAIAEATPGPIAINTATFVGYKKKGVIGSAAATLGIVLPSFVIIFIISLFAEQFKQNEYVKYAFAGIKAGVAFLILKTGINMLIKCKRNAFNIISFSVVLASMILIELFSVSFSALYFILIGGALGIFLNAVLRTGKKEETK